MTSTIFPFAQALDTGSMRCAIFSAVIFVTSEQHLPRTDAQDGLHAQVLYWRLRACIARVVFALWYWSLCASQEVSMLKMWEVSIARCSKCLPLSSPWFWRTGCWLCNWIYFCFVGALSGSIIQILCVRLQAYNTRGTKALPFHSSDLIQSCTHRRFLMTTISQCKIKGAQSLSC